MCFLFGKECSWLPTGHTSLLPSNHSYFHLFIVVFCYLVFPSFKHLMSADWPVNGLHTLKYKRTFAQAVLTYSNLHRLLFYNACACQCIYSDFEAVLHGQHHLFPL